MNNYRVSFFKDLLSSDGHNSKCLQEQIDVQSEGPSEALVLAEQRIDSARLDADRVEVVRLACEPADLKHSSENLPGHHKHT